MAALGLSTRVTSSLRFPARSSLSAESVPPGSALEPVHCGGRWRPGKAQVHHRNSRKHAWRCKVTRAEVAVLDGELATQTMRDEKLQEEIFACPICFEPLARKGVPGNKQAAVARSGFQCRRCKKAYSTRDVYLDFTVLNGAKEYEEVQWAGTEVFRSPVVSFVYERGWRQNFSRSDFPGPDEEFKMALDYLTPTFGGVVVDVSCGSGLFTRRFAQSGLFRSVIALDYSENMLRQTSEFLKQDKSLDGSDIALIRADVGRLPFATGSIDAIHAGAAIHCWPSPSIAVAEISRVLRPGGVFVATTFLIFNQPYMIKPVRQAVQRAVGRFSRAWDASELEEVCTLSGLENYCEEVRGMFIMFSARRPEP